jgi:hypothetical protein
VTQTVAVELVLPDDLRGFHLPRSVDERLTSLLDRQDAGKPLSKAEREEAEGLVELAEMLTLLQLRAERASSTRRGR